MGRRSEYTEAIADQICESLASGETITAVCRRDDMPGTSTVFRWLASIAEFRELYARARESQADVWAQEIIDIADTCRVGQKLEEKEIGRVCSLCGRGVHWLGGRDGWNHVGVPESTMCDGAKSDKLMEAKTVSADMVERSRLQIDARKWAAAKGAPKRYGDRLELAGDKDAPLTITVRRMDR